MTEQRVEPNYFYTHTRGEPYPSEEDVNRLIGNLPEGASLLHPFSMQFIQAPVFVRSTTTTNLPPTHPTINPPMIKSMFGGATFPVTDLLVITLVAGEQKQFADNLHEILQMVLESNRKLDAANNQLNDTKSKLDEQKKQFEKFQRGHKKRFVPIHEYDQLIQDKVDLMTEVAVLKDQAKGRAEAPLSDEQIEEIANLKSTVSNLEVQLLKNAEEKKSLNDEISSLIKKDAETHEKMAEMERKAKKENEEKKQTKQTYDDQWSQNQKLKIELAEQENSFNQKVNQLKQEKLDLELKLYDAEHRVPSNDAQKMVKKQKLEIESLKKQKSIFENQLSMFNLQMKHQMKMTKVATEEVVKLRSGKSSHSTNENGEVSEPKLKIMKMEPMRTRSSDSDEVDKQLFEHNLRPVFKYNNPFQNKDAFFQLVVDQLKGTFPQLSPENLKFSLFDHIHKTGKLATMRESWGETLSEGTSQLLQVTVKLFSSNGLQTFGEEFSKRGVVSVAYYTNPVHFKGTEPIGTCIVID